MIKEDIHLQIMDYREVAQKICSLPEEEGLKEIRYKAMALGGHLTALQRRLDMVTDEQTDELLVEVRYAINQLDSLTAQIKPFTSQPEPEPKQKEQTNTTIVRELIPAEVPYPKLVSLSGVQKSYTKGTFTLHEVTMTIRAGEVTGVAGANGYGKSTLLKIIAGIMNPDNGSVSYPLLPHNVTTHDYWATVKSKVAYLPQDVPIENGTILQNLKLAGALHGIKGTENDLWADYYINRFGLWDDRNKLIKELSGGQRLRFALAKILITEPQVLVLDEPLANLDVNMKTVLMNDLRILADSRKNPLGIVVSSHDLLEVEKVADNMLILDKGIVKFQGKTKQIGWAENCNAFEVELDNMFNYFTLLDKLKGLEVIRVDNRTTSFVIYTPLSVTCKAVLQHLLNNDVIPESFIDISHSSKRLIIKAV